jgi:REP element-mobilizing transposase RayT
MRKPPVVLPPDLRPVVGAACLEQFAKEDIRLHAIAVGGEHVHVAVDCLPDGLKQLVGRVKKVSSHRIRSRLPGKVWALGCKPVAVKDDRHWQNVFRYVLAHAPKAWVWASEEARGLL